VVNPSGIFATDGRHASGARSCFPRPVVNAFLADLMVAIHVGYVAYVVLGQLAVWVGLAFRRRWARNFWFRVTHLAAILFVAAEEVIGMRCPLTEWEEHFRTRAGQPVSGETFLSRLMHDLIFIDFEQKWVYAAIHIGCAAVVLLTFVIWPPRWPFRKPEMTSK
jgi:hypothetical protein